MTDKGLRFLGWCIFWGLCLNGCMQTEITRVYVDGVLTEAPHDPR